mgnify:CR=1 FL=1
MADAVDTITLHSSATYLAVRLLSKSDGTGESAVAKVDKSALVDSDGNEPAAVDIIRCSGIVFGASHVALNWDHTTDDEALILSGSFYFDYEDFGPLKDPRSAGGTGDLLLTTSGMVANGGYNIDLLLRLRPKNSV